MLRELAKMKRALGVQRAGASSVTFLSLHVSSSVPQALGRATDLIVSSDMLISTVKQMAIDSFKIGAYAKADALQLVWTSCPIDDNLTVESANLLPRAHLVLRMARTREV